MGLSGAHDEDRPRFRVDDDIEAVLQAIVDHDIQVEGGGNAAARALDNEDAGQVEALSSSQRCDCSCAVSPGVGGRFVRKIISH